MLSSGLSPAFRASPDQQATVTENKPAHLVIMKYNVHCLVSYT